MFAELGGVKYGLRKVVHHKYIRISSRVKTPNIKRAKMQYDMALIDRVATVLVKVINKKYPGNIQLFREKGYEVEDLEQEVRIFCLDAYTRYDEMRGVAFFTFLYVHSRNRLMNLFRSIARIPHMEEIADVHLTCDEQDILRAEEIDNFCMGNFPDAEPKPETCPIQMLLDKPDPAKYSDPVAYEEDLKDWQRQNRKASIESFAAQTSRLDRLKLVAGVSLPKSRRTKIRKELGNE